MSKVSIQGDQNGTGDFTIKAPNSNVDRTLTLPDEEGTILSSGSPLSNFPTEFRNGISVADTFRLTSNFSSNDAFITSNLERVDDASTGFIGAGITESSGVFSFPSTGVYFILVTAELAVGDQDTFAGVRTEIALDGSIFSLVARTSMGTTDTSSLSRLGSGVSHTFVNVNDTSLVKARFKTQSMTNGTELLGDTTFNRTSITFIRLGDT